MKNRVILLVAIFGLIVFIGCKKEESVVSGVIQYDKTPYDLQYFGLTPPTIPTDNPLTVEGVKLGRMLFYEKQLSKDGTLSCASCHNQTTGFSDTNRFSIGILGLPGGRQAMAVCSRFTLG